MAQKIAGKDIATQQATHDILSMGRSFVHFAKDIKISHSLFALPFAASALVIGQIGFPTLAQTIFLLLCMVGARSFAMGMNRYLDRDIDALNPRTQIRMIPSGALQPGQTLAWSIISAGVFVTSAFALNQTAGYLSLPVLAILASYSMLKRFTWFCHLWLGACLGFAPVAVSIALTGGANIAVVFLAIAVTFWTAGFDILYSIQDVKFDKLQNLKSIPAKFGIKRSLWVSRGCFAITFAFLLLVGFFADSGFLYFFGIMIIGGILIYEHLMVKDLGRGGSISKIGPAFFTANAYISVIYLIFTVSDSLINLGFG